MVAVDSLAATAAAAAKAKAGHRFEVMIEFNSDGHRAGVSPEPRRIESDFDCAWHKSRVTLAVAPGPA